jgi:hypothetical protein
MNEIPMPQENARLEEAIEIDAYVVEDLARLETLETQLRQSRDIPEDLWDEYMGLTKYIKVPCTIKDGWVIPSYPLAVGISVSYCKECPPGMTSFNFSITPNTILGLDKTQILELIRNHE